MFALKVCTERVCTLKGVSDFYLRNLDWLAVVDDSRYWVHSHTQETLS